MTARIDGPGARRTFLDRALRATSAALLVAALLLGAGEIAARSTVVPPANPYTPHAYFKLFRTPGYRQWRWSIEEPPYRFLFEANALGFRGKSMTTVEKPPGTYRIFFVGASTTENQHLPEDRTFPGLVETRLAARFGGNPRVEVANCGVSGFGAARSLSLIEHRVLKLAPDLVVVLDAENDMMASLEERWDPTNAFLDVDEPNLQEWVSARSALVAWLYGKVSHKDTDARRLFAKRRAMARARPYLVPPDEDLVAGLPGFEAYLRWIALVCADAGVPLALMTQPTLWKADATRAEVEASWMACCYSGRTHLDPGTAARLMATYNDSVRRVAAQKGCLLVDLAAAVPKDLAHFTDDAHLTARGNEAVADAIVPALVRGGKLPGRIAPR